MSLIWLFIHFRFLIGDKLNFHIDPPEVSTKFYGEDDINPVSHNNPNQPKKPGRPPKQPAAQPQATPLAEIMNGKSRMVFDKSTSVLSVSFENMILKKFKRAEKKSKDIEVTDQKYGVVFETFLKFGDQDYHIRVNNSLFHKQGFLKLFLI